MHRTRETEIYMVHIVWATSTEKKPVLPFILSNKLKRYNLQHSIVIPSSLSHNLLSLSHIEYRSTQTQYFLIYSEGFPSMERKSKLNITSTVKYPPNERPIFTTKLQHFTRKFYIYFQPLPPPKPPLWCTFYGQRCCHIMKWGPMQ